VSYGKGVRLAADFRAPVSVVLPAPPASSTRARLGRARGRAPSGEAETDRELVLGSLASLLLDGFGDGIDGLFRRDDAVAGRMIVEKNVTREHDATVREVDS